MKYHVIPLSAYEVHTYFQSERMNRIKKGKYVAAHKIFGGESLINEGSNWT